MAYLRCTGNSGGSLKLRTAQGEIASFETNIIDLLKEVKCNINPVQDLHGYDHPWPAGGGKNKLFLTTPEGTYTKSGITYKVNADGTVETSGTATADDYLLLWNKNDNDDNKLLVNGNYILNGCASGGSGNTYYITTNGFGGVSDSTGVGSNFTVDSSLPQTNILISVKNGTNMNGKVFKPMIRLASISEPTFEPYSNICPISGFTEANITRCGVNLWDFTEIIASSSVSNYYFNFPSKTYTLSFELENATYQNGGAALFDFYDKDGTNFAYPTPTLLKRSSDDASMSSLTQPLNDRFYFTFTNSLSRIRLNFVTSGYGQWTGKIKNVTLTEGTAKTYHHYNGQTFTAAFGQTVYGGVLDVTRGKVKPCIEYPSYNGETLSGRWLSSEATYIEGTTPPIGSQVVSLDDYGSDIDLTPEVISSVVGTNNVFADCGETEVKYLKAEG